MASINPAIFANALQGMPTMQDLKQMQYRNQLSQLEVENAQQQAQSRNALTQLLRQPGSIDPQTGMPTQQAVGQVMQIDPERGMELQNSLAQYRQHMENMQTAKIHQNFERLNLNEKQAEIVGREAISLVTEAEDMKNKGMTDQQIAAVLGPRQAEVIDRLSKQGVLTEQAANALKGNFNLEAIKAVARAGGAPYKQYLDEKKQAKAAETAGMTPFQKEASDLYGKGTEEYKKAVEKHISRMDAPPQFMAGGGEVSLKTDEKGQEYFDIGGQKVPKKTVEYYTKQSLAGDFSWRQNLGRNKFGQAIIAAVESQLPEAAGGAGITPEEASAQKGQRDALNAALKDRTKYIATANQFVGNFNKQTELVEKYLKTGVAGSIPIINRWIQSGRKSIAGDPEVTAFDTAIRGLAREHQRIVTGVTSNAQLHSSAQTTADELLNKDMTADQVRASLKVMREEAKNALDSGKSEVDDLKSQLKNLGVAGKQETQDQRDIEAGKILVNEYGGIEKAKSSLKELDVSIASAKGDAKRILQGERDRLKKGIDSMSSEKTDQTKKKVVKWSDL